MINIVILLVSKYNLIYANINTLIEDSIADINESQDIEDVLNEFEEKYFNYYYTSNVLSTDILKIINSPMYTTYANNRTSQYDKNKAKLRAANFIEYILDIDEGLTSKDCIYFFKKLP